MQIYAELSKKYSKKIDDGLADFNLPDGVTLSQRHRGRFCYMDCDGEISRGLLVAFLESRGIPWQDNDK